MEEGERELREGWFVVVGCGTWQEQPNLFIQVFACEQDESAKNSGTSHGNIRMPMQRGFATFVPAFSSFLVGDALYSRPREQ